MGCAVVLQRLLRQRPTAALVLLPDLVAVGRGERGGQRKLHSTRLEGGNGWEPCVAAAGALLTELGIRRQDRVAVLFSDRFAAYFTVPWSERLLRRRDGESFVREHVAALDSGMGTDAEIRVDAAGYGAPRVACVVERDFLSAIDETLRSRSVRPTSCTPLLAAGTQAASRVLRKMGKGPAVVAAVEPHAMKYALFLNGAWADVGSELIAEATPTAVDAALGRIRLRDSRLDGGYSSWFLDAASDQGVDLAGKAEVASARGQDGSRAEALLQLALEIAP